MEGVGVLHQVSMDIEIVPLASSHWPAVRSIYEEGLASGNATFETSAPEWEEWSRSHLEPCRLVAIGGPDVVGWAALSDVSDRCVYAGVAEVSVYVADAARGQGIGRKLLEAVIEASERAGLWTIEAGMFPQNDASIRLHRSCGFRVIGTRERIGKMNGVWRDVVRMERRSPTVGVD